MKLVREFKYDKVNTIPAEVAKQGKQLFDIQSIVTHRFKGNKKTPLINLREWGKKIRLNRNTILNEIPTEETPTEEPMVFPPPVNEPPSPTW